MKPLTNTLAKLSPILALFLIPMHARADVLKNATIPLDSGWEFRRCDASAGSATANWMKAVVPGQVSLDLLRLGLIPDPFYRDNESKLQWIGTAEWEYRTSFEANATMLRRGNVELVFEGLDAACTVYLNDNPILTADNMFRVWRIDVRPFIKIGANTLRVVFSDPEKAAEKAAASDPWREKTGVQARNYIRKAAYEHGWDWGPIFVNSGIWRPVSLDVWDAARISDLHVRQTDVAHEVAHLSAEAEIVAASDVDAKLTLEYAAPNGNPVRSETPVRLHGGANFISVPVEIDKPLLWYPVGYGNQPLYTFKASLSTGNIAVGERNVRTGLRNIVLRREVDKWGRSFEFVVNGIPVFAKGADVIPFDSFPGRVTDKEYREILQSAVDANMNMIRHWGGGYYETQEFYNICDELGLMVWQDFMFGNEMQPGDYSFKLSVAKEAADQLRRLRNHPSIVLWCGNNEMESHFRWPDMKNIDEKTMTRMWTDYVSISSGILGQAVQKYSPETPFWPSSPSADYEETSSEYESGDIHNWDIWHGRKSFAEYADKHFRFISEYGFQSFPEMRTVEAYTEPGDRRDIFTPVMLAHQKSPNGNELIHNYMLRDYDEPKDFAAFLYASQVLQAEGVKLGAEHMRRERPRCMGSIFWQLNDCWPVASWSSIDYFGRWKALQYYARRFYAPVLVSPWIADGALEVYVVSDRTDAVYGSLRVRLMGFDGTVLRDETQAVRAEPLSSKLCLCESLDKFVPSGADATKVFVAVEFSSGGTVLSRNLIHLRPTKEIRLPEAHIQAQVIPDGEGCIVRLKTDVLARSVQLSFGDSTAKPSDNYFDMLPGETADIRVTGSDTETVRSNLCVRSLSDAFVPKVTR